MAIQFPQLQDASAASIPTQSRGFTTLSVHRYPPRISDKPPSPSFLTARLNSFYTATLKTLPSRFHPALKDLTHFLATTDILRTITQHATEHPIELIILTVSLILQGSGPSG